MEEPILPKLWGKEDDAIIIDSFNKKHRAKDALELAASRLPDRTFGTISNRFYTESAKGNYDGKIHNTKFKKLREKQKLGPVRKKQPKTIIKEQGERIIVIDDTTKSNEVGGGQEKNKLPIQASQDKISLEVQKEDNLSFTVQGTTLLGGIPIRAKFKITGQFSIDILPLDSE